VEPSQESRNPAAFFEQLADRHGIPVGCIKAIETRAVSPAKTSLYEELVTEVRLDDVEQVRFGAFVHSIEKENPQYLIKQIRLTASDKGVAAWNASVTVSLLIYEPANTEGL